MKPDPQNENLLKQIQELIDGSISRADFESLKLELASNPSAQEKYVAHLEVESLLHQNLGSAEPVANLTTKVLPEVPELTTHQSDSSSLSYRRVFLTVAATLAAILAFGNLWLIPEPVAIINIEKSGDPLPSSQLLRQSVARLTNGNEAFKLESSGWKPMIGSRLGAGSSYLLSQGNIELTFDAGTTVQIVSPARFSVVDFDEIRLEAGKLTADVPEQAIGFRVHTPSGKIVDFSTRFSVDVDEAGSSDVHVIEGLVEATPSLVDQQPIPLVENTALRLSRDAFPKKVEFVPTKAVEFASRNSGGQLDYMHFSFDEDLSSGNVRNYGTGGQGQGGEIVAEGEDAWLQVSGRVGKAIFFTGKPAEIKTNVKGISGSHPRTIAFWTRIMPDSHPRNAYAFMGWGSSEENSGGNWQMGWNPNFDGDEGVQGAVRTEFGGGYVVGTTDLRDGKWHHVASVFVGSDVNGTVAQQVRHYVDGKLEGISGFKDKTINTDADAKTVTIGDYIFSGSPFFGSFKGWMDEMYLFDTALTPAQVVQIMNSNRVPEQAEIVPVSEEF